MFLSGDGRATQVVEAARWADTELQGVARRLAWAVLVSSPESVGSFLRGAKLLMPTDLAVAVSRPVILLGARLNRASPDRVRKDLAALPGMLDHADRLLAEGVVDAEAPNAATLQVTSSVALLGCLEDIRPLLADRPVVSVARELFPDYPGDALAGSIPAF